VKRNPGHLPAEAQGKRVRVRLADGSLAGVEPVSTVSPAGWAADGRNGCRWSRTGSPFDIDAYEVLR
jgi:hypothetical protein